MTTNYDLKEEIRAYWSARSDTFDNSPGHLIRTEREFDAYERLLRRHAGEIVGGDVLDVASGTGEVTRLLRRLGCSVTGIDLSPNMVERCRAKHASDPDVRIIEGDTERLTLPDGEFDGIVCRNLIWTLTDPEAAFAEWFRVLHPGGIAIAFEGNWMNPDRLSLLFRAISMRLGRRVETELPDFTDILARLPFREGLVPSDLGRRMTEAGFDAPEFHPVWNVTAAQLAKATWAERFSLMSYARGRFMMVARKPRDGT